MALNKKNGKKPTPEKDSDLPRDLGSSSGQDAQSAHISVQLQKGEENLTEAQRSFLAVYREMGVIRRACEVAGVGRRTHYDWMEAKPDYKEAFEAAKEDAADSLEVEVYRRAVTGVDKPAGWYKGKAGGMVREYSDTLLIFALKALRPEKYRERVELRGVMANLDLSRLDDETLGRIAAGENVMSVLSSWASGARSRGENPARLLGLPSGDLEGEHDPT